MVKGRFTGDASYEYEHTEIKRIGEGEDAQEEESTVSCSRENSKHAKTCTVLS